MRNLIINVSADAMISAGREIEKKNVHCSNEY